MPKETAMNLRELSDAIEKELVSLFQELRTRLAAREDSRAFGAMIERRILDNWQDIRKRCGFTPVRPPWSPHYLRLRFYD